MRRPAALLAAAVAASGALVAPADADPLRSLAGTMPSAGPRAGDYGAVLAAMDALGARATALSLAWDLLEADGAYAADPDWPAIAEAVYPPRNLSLHLTFAVIDTGTDRRPADLRALAWDDPRVARRFVAFAEAALARMPSTDLAAIAVGNEVDAHLRGRDWAAFGRFLDAVTPRLRALRPGVPVTTTMTWDGLRASAAARRLSARGDALSVTWYPAGPGFDFGAPVDADAALDAMARVAAGRPIHLAEVGAPSDGCGSTPERQAETLARIDAAARARSEVALVQFVWSHDVSAAAVAAEAAFHGIADPCFARFLGSLGLRDAADRAKPAFDALRR